MYLPNDANTCEVSAADIAGALGVTERAVRMKCRDWAGCLYKSGRGGQKILFTPDLLPPDVRSALTTASVCGMAPSAGAAAARADGLMTEAETAAAARLQAHEAGLAAFNALPAERRREAEARRELLRARDAFIGRTRLPKKRGTALFIRELAAGAIDLPDWIVAAAATRKGQVSMSWASLQRWEKAYAAGGIAALASGYRATAESSVPEHMQRFIAGMRVDHPHAGIPKIMKGLKARFDGQAIPAESAVRRFVARWNAENDSLLAYLTNPDDWRSGKAFAAGDMAEAIIRLNQLWEMDSTPADVMLTDGRHTVIGVIDIFSRRGRLLVSKTSKATAVAALIRRAIIDWGVPETIKTDNGADYVSRHIVRVLESLEIEQQLCTPFSPEQKPFVERFLGTFSHDIVELLPGYIGHSVADRQTIRARQTFAQRMMKRGEVVEIKMSSAEFQKLCDRWVDAMYHQDAHGGLGGKTPAQVARAWMGPVRRISNVAALDMLMCEAPGGDGMRTIGKKGVQTDNGFYIAAEMAGHEGERVLVLYDSTDWGTVRCFTVGADGGQKYLCTAIDAERAGVDRAEVAAVVRATQNRVMREGAAELKKVAKEAGTREIHREILRHREAEIANVVDIPRRSEEYTSPALEDAALAVADTRRRELGPRPIAISEREERQALAVIDLAEQRNERALPANDWERYEMIDADLRAGRNLPDADLAFMKRYELYLETGEREAL